MHGTHDRYDWTMPDPTTHRPNVVVIIMDDLTWGDLGCHGNPHTQTPHLDAMHGQSTRLERYCTGPLCTPARVSLMTGRYPYRTRAIDTYCGRSMMDPDEVTLAEVLRDAGYATCISGKWHLGDCYPMRACDKGFDESLVHNGGGLRQPGNLGHFDDPPRDDYFNPLLTHNGRRESVEGYCTDIFTDHAMRFIEAHRDDPFFLYLGTNAPHTPCIVDDEWSKRYLELGYDEKLAKLYGMVDNIDHNVGRLLGKLDERQLADDTIVIYTSDHGAQGGGQHGLRDRFRFNSGLRGGKGTPYDGGIKTPCFWRWPGRFDAGRVIDRITNPVDYLPTLAAACGATVPEDRTIDGVNLLPLLLGETSADDWPQRHCFVQWHRGDEPVRDRNFACVGDRYKLCRTHETKPLELYDLIADPQESRDIADEQPDIVGQMHTAYHAWFEDVSSERPMNFAPPPIVVGSPHEITTVLTRQDWRVDGDDGWTDEIRAHWHVTVAAAGDYNVRVEWAPLPQPAELHVQIGNVEYRTPVAAGRSELSHPLALPEGRAIVRADLTAEDGGCLAARYVTIQPA